MSNYKPRIESNNLDLTSILSTINELPEAGASVETCTVQITQSEIPSDVYYVDGNLSIQFTNSSSVIEVLKNNILVTNAMYVEIISGGASYIVTEGSFGKYGVMITGDASIKLHI